MRCRSTSAGPKKPVSGFSTITCLPAPRAGTPPPLALRDRDVRGARGARVLRPRPDEPIVAVLLEHVRGPAGHAAHREDRRELVGGNAHGRVARAGEEVHVRVDVLL